MVSARNAKVLAKLNEPANDEGQHPERKRIEDILDGEQYWFDDAGNGFYRLDDDAGWIGYNESQFKRHLKFNGYFASPGKYEVISQVEAIMTRLQHERRLDFAGNVAGYPAGIHTIAGNKILIPRGPKLLTPKRGRWDTLKSFFSVLLRDDVKLLYAWLKSAHVSLRAGFPWRPGQLLGLAGPAGCGKSLLQNLITEILGGRSCKPYGYLTGQTSFNSNYFGAEHWMIEDEASSTDMRVRRTFGAMLKNVLVNQVQNFHAKGRDAISVTPFLRMTISLNDTPESLLVLPPLEDDIIDKIILLRAWSPDVPYVTTAADSREKFWKQLTSEIPAFLHALERWEVPKEIRNERYGVRAYQNANLLASVHALSNEARLLQIIDTCGMFDERLMPWQGTALELETRLLELDRQSIVSRLLPYHTLCGIYLKRLCKTNPSRVRLIEGEGRGNTYEIKPRT